MKTNRTLTLMGGVCLTLLLIYSCQKTDIGSNHSEPSSERVVYQTVTFSSNSVIVAGGVTLTAPATVTSNEQFEISADVTCGRIAIERAYILGQDNVTKIYTGLTCGTANLLWEEIVPFQCYTSDASWNGSLNSAGTYVFRTKHNGSDGNCDGLGGSNTSGNCSFSGNQFYCFMIEVIDCETSFSGEALACGTERQAVYTFKSTEALGYIKIQGGLTNFTGADAVVNISGGSLTSTQFTPGGSSNRVITITGSVAACETIIITISWNSSNPGGVITGNWSVKDTDGNEITPSVAGLECE